MSLGRTLRPIGVSTVSTRWPMNRNSRGWKTNRAAAPSIRKGTWPDSRARQPGRVPAGDLEGDLGSRVARPDHQDATRLELGRVAVAGRVELDDAGTEVGGEGEAPGGPGRRTWRPPRCRPPSAGRPRRPRSGRRSATAGPRGRRSGPGAGTGSRRPPGSRPPGPWWGTSGPEPGNAASRQRAVAGRGEQPQRVPALAPGVADPLVGVQDQERPSPPGQVAADRQAGLAATDDHGLERCSGSGMLASR